MALLHRRKFLTLGASAAVGLIAAPAIVRASSLMAVKPIPWSISKIMFQGSDHIQGSVYYFDWKEDQLWKYESDTEEYTKI